MATLKQKLGNCNDNQRRRLVRDTQNSRKIYANCAVAVFPPIVVDGLVAAGDARDMADPFGVTAPSQNSWH